jgi:zinc protease
MIIKLRLFTVVLSLFSIILTGVNGVSAAENQTSATVTSTEAWRKTPPKAPPPADFKLPNVVAYKLPNGLQVQLLEDHRVPFVTFNLGIRAGSVLEPADLRGLASVTADMITEGTAKRTSKQIAEEVDFIGGGLKGGSDYDFTLVSGSTLSKYTDRLMDAVSDVVLNPTFPEDELNLQKQNLLQELVMKRSQPDFLLEERFNKVVFGEHPYAVVAPTPESVGKITRQDIVNFHAKNYLPNAAILVVVGDFKVDQMKALIDKDFGANWKSGNVVANQLANPPALKGRHIYLIDRPGSVQSSIKLGNVGIKKSDPDYFATLVMNQILGGAAHSRLFLNIREQKGYTYGAYSSFAARREPGAFGAEAEVRSDVTGPALKEFIYELDRIRDAKVTDKELADAKAFLVGSFQLGLETQSGLAQRLLESKLYDLPPNYLETYTQKLLAVTPDDVQRVAKARINAPDMAIVVVGDAKKIKPALDPFAPVTIYDTSGKVMEATKNPAPAS